MAWRTLHFPAAVSAEATADLLRQIAADKFVPLIAFEVEATGENVIHRVGVPATGIERVAALFDAHFSDGVLTLAGKRSLPDAAWRVGLSSRYRPVLVEAPERITRAILAGLNGISRGESVTVQWLLGPARSPRAVPATVRASVVEPWWSGLLAGDHELDSDRRRALADKNADHAFAVAGRLGITAATADRRRALAVSVLAALKVAETPGVSVRLVKEQTDNVVHASRPWRWPTMLNVRELVGLLAWPLGEGDLPGIERRASRWLRPDPRLRGHRRVLGISTAPGESREIGLSIDDARQHLHLVGPTGAGKSALLGHLVLADAAAGRSVVLIDGKGDLVDEVLARVPESRRSDVVVIDASDTARPVGLNPLAKHGRDPELVADQILAAFHGMYESQWGPRLQVILHAALLTLAARGDSSLCVLPALLTNPAVRRRLVAGLDDPVALEPFWAWFESISDAERQQAIAPVLSRLQPLLLRKNLRAIVGQVEPRFRVEDLFIKRRIVLVSLAKGLVGPEAAALLGSLFVAELWQAVLERARVAPSKRHPVMVYADEFQDYVHLPTDMADALAQARGLGVGLTLAHQHLGQLPPGLRAAILANAQSRVAFRTSADDANAMSRLSGGSLRPEDFQHLRRFEAYAQVVEGGEIMSPVSIRTLPLAPGTDDSAGLRAASRERYGRPVGEIDAEIRKLIQGDADAEQPVGRRRRGER